MVPVSDPLYLNNTNSSQNAELESDTQPNSSNKSPIKCPRCSSTNTKFCYYNNYSRLQPRHYCRGCRRHWTAGGTLRDVPFGGGRKCTKRRKSSQHYNTDPGIGTDIGTSSETNLSLPPLPFSDTMFLPHGPFFGDDAESAHVGLMYGAVNIYEGVGSTWQLPATMPSGYWDEITDLI